MEHVWLAARRSECLETSATALVAGRLWLVRGARVIPAVAAAYGREACGST